MGRIFQNVDEPEKPPADSGYAHIDDIVNEGERVNSLGRHSVGEIGVVGGKRVRITAIYKNGKFEYVLLTNTR